MVLSNLQSGGNIGNILRSASIFGCQECLVVGQKRHRLTGDHGSRFDLPRKHVWTHTDARNYLHAKEVRIYGVEIMEDASPIMQYNTTSGVVDLPFDRQYQGAAFVMGNEGNGLSQKQKEICDEFIYIPQTRGGSSSTDGSCGSASLNVACAATVILQAYCLWASYPVAGMEGEIFVASTSQ
jgi:tRNA G18 (ribose-2'-O)-methylase SpoU